VAPAFSHSTLRSSSGEGGSGSSSFFTQAGVPWGFRRLSQARLLGVCCFSGCSRPVVQAGHKQEGAMHTGERREGGRPQGGTHTEGRMVGSGSLAVVKGIVEPACSQPTHPGSHHTCTCPSRAHPGPHQASLWGKTK
jgi:hypothetical protein